MNAIDTNVWIYRYDTRDPAKQHLAIDLLTQVRPWFLVWQVGCEFVAASRKLAGVGFSEADAWRALADMLNNVDQVLLPDPQLWAEAQSVQSKHALSFWDALLVAACIRGGVTTLYTENMGAPRTVESLALVNPFLTTP
jgi:predicted nucleic acid-binding protein